MENLFASFVAKQGWRSSGRRRASAIWGHLHSSFKLFQKVFSPSLKSTIKADFKTSSAFSLNQLLSIKPEMISHRLSDAEEKYRELERRLDPPAEEELWTSLSHDKPVMRVSIEALKNNYLIEMLRYTCWWYPQDSDRKGSIRAPYALFTVIE